MNLIKVNIENISIKNPTPVDIIKQTKFNLESNTIYSILGSNGYGKTTLLLSLANLLNKNIFSINGEVLIDSKNIFQMTEEEIIIIRRNYFQYIMQSPSAAFDPLKNFGFYFDMVKNKNLLESLAAKCLLPEIQSLKKKHIYEVSEGQAQRIMFCIAISNEPRILILDEPTSSLDLHNIKIISKLINDFVNETNAVLLVSHDKYFIDEISDKVAILENGKLSEFINNNKSDEH